jgi:hypothetical protein
MAFQPRRPQGKAKQGQSAKQGQGARSGQGAKPSQSKSKPGALDSMPPQVREISMRLMRDPKFLATIEAAFRETRVSDDARGEIPTVKVEGGKQEQSFGWSTGGEVALVGPAAAVAAVAVAVIPLAVGPGTFGGGTRTGTGTGTGTGDTNDGGTGRTGDTGTGETGETGTGETGETGDTGTGETGETGTGETGETGETGTGETGDTGTGETGETDTGTDSDRIGRLFDMLAELQLELAVLSQRVAKTMQQLGR